MSINLDEDALFAAADLVGRTGAKSFEIGYLRDDVPAAEAGWYAHAQYKGARITEEGAGPIEAAEALGTAAPGWGQVHQVRRAHRFVGLGGVRLPLGHAGRRHEVDSGGSEGGGAVPVDEDGTALGGSLPAERRLRP